MLHEIAHAGLQAAQYVVHVVAATPAPTSSPASKPSDSGSNFAGLAAIIASVTGLVSAIGAIMIGLRKRDGNGRSEAADKAIEYLIKQNKDLLAQATKQGKAAK